ncbi:recombinase family protein [Pseudarthrobacter siccitolerans]
MTTRAAIYCRISKDREGAGLGVQRQEQDCREVAARLGWHVAHVFVDNDISAYSGKVRPQYRQLLEAIKSGAVTGVIAWHTDRLHRSPLELEEYIDASESQGVTTQTVKAGEIDLSTPSGRAVARTLGAWARYESEHKSERITRKKLQLAQTGSFSGGPVPFGWAMNDGKPEIVEADAKEIRQAVTAAIAGASIGSLVRDFNDRGVLTRRGQKWTSTAIRNLLLRPTNAGLSAYRGEIVGVSTFPAIISEDEWRTVTAIIKNPDRRSNTDSRIRHLLAGILRCGNCGAAMKTSSRSDGRSETSKFYYKCPTRGDGHAFQTATPVELLIADMVIARLEQPGVIARLSGPQNQDKQHELQAEAGLLRGRLDEAANSFADGLITAKQMETITSRVGERLEAVSADLAVAARASVVPAAAAENVRAWWESANIERQRSVIDALMTPFVEPIRKSAPRVFDPRRIRIEWK